MAQRRMFHADIVESDRFLDLPPGAQLLYFHLGMQADDDGFVNGPRQVCRKLRRPPRELKLLIQEGFLLDFDGIVVIKHFRLANQLKRDRIKPFIYPHIAQRLYITPSKEYSLEPQPDCQNLLELRSAVLESKWNPRREEDNPEEPNQTQPSSGKTSGEEDPDGPPDQLRLLGGQLGQGVVLINNKQIDQLIDIMGLEAFEAYMKKLADYNNNGGKIKNAYQTLLKFYNEDKEV